LYIDIDSNDLPNDLSLFVGIMEALERCSPDASVFVLIHKMDLVAEDDREREFHERAALVQSKTAQYVKTPLIALSYSYLLCL
jgi:Ras-related GTP-binding protein A/B